MFSSSSHFYTQGNYHRLSLLSSSDEAEAEAAAGGAVTTAKVHHHYHGPSLQVVSSRVVVGKPMLPDRMITKCSLHPQRQLHCFDD